MAPPTRFRCEPSAPPLPHASAPTPKGPRWPPFLSSRGSPPLHGHFLNHRFQEDEERFIKCNGVGESESWGPETGVATPFTFKTFPSLTPGPDSVDICAIARPGGNQIIFKPEIIFFIIVTDSIFFLFCVTRCVCTYIYIYIYYKYQRNYISILGWENEGGICLRRMILLFSFLRPAGKEGRHPSKSSFSSWFPLFCPSYHLRR